MNVDQPSNNDHKMAEILEQQRSNFEINIHDIIESWANKLANNAGTTLKWLDLPYKQAEVLQSQRYIDKQVHQLKITVQPIHYLEPVTRLEQEKQLVNRRYEALKNESTILTPLELTINAEVTQRRTHTFTWGLNLGMSLDAKTPFGGIGFTAELDLTSSKEQTREVKDGISRKVEVKVQGLHEATCRVEVWIIPCLQDFIIKLNLEGYVPIKFNDKVRYKEGHVVRDSTGNRKQFISITQIFQALKDQQLLPKELTYEIDKDQVILTQKGQYKVDEFKSEVNIEKQTSLTTSEESIHDATAVDQQNTTASEKASGSYTYKPQVSVTGNRVIAQIEKLNQKNGVESERISKMIITVMTQESKVADKDSEAAREQFKIIHNDRPKPEDNKNRNIVVGHSYSHVGNELRFE